MVLPVIVAGARVAGTTVARTGAVAARKGIQGATRTTASAARKGTQNIGRNITRLKRNSTPISSESRIKPIDTVRTKRSQSPQSAIRRSDNSNESEESEEFGGVQMNSEQNRKLRIGNMMAIILLLIAAFFDLTEFALDLAGTFLAGFGVVIGYVKDVTSLLFFPTAFLLLGAPFWKGRKAKKKIIAMVTAIIVSAIPWLGAIMPETLISVAVTIYLTRLEDNPKDTMDTVNKNIVRAKRARQIAQKFRR